ncbi:MAG: cytochrome c family protein [Leptospiraceae bacterium]|nr:cytochrome c family protein [Leptospiraceae bacterium]MDW8306733.1 cytochrome c3 family protein [Leptospiraceae bacterium]
MVLKLVKIGLPLFVVAFLAWVIFAPPQRVGYAPEQPIAYSHALHAGKHGMDCQYCHTGVAVNKKAGVPSLNICMNCHAYGTMGYSGGKLSPEIAKLKKYYEEKKSPEWIRVHNLPDHVRFAHAPHIKALLKEGAPTKEACVPCHGQVEQMVVVSQVMPLNMGFCVNCHRDYRNAHEYRNRGVAVSCNFCHY